MILAILEAGLSRPRSAEMMMAPVLGEPFIWRQIERVRRARTLGRIVVATSRDPRDDRLSGYLISRGQTVFRGDAHDLAGGYARCAETAGDPTHVVHIRAETPLIDPGVIDEAVRYAVASSAPLVSNTAPCTYPRGLEVEVFSAAALACAAAESAGEARACISGFLQGQPERFEAAHFRARRDWSGFDWTVHSAETFALVRAVFETLFPLDPDFGVEEALDYIDRRPDLAEMRSAAVA
jgi:spore coat polysaccharide biosynthesis protein SpsF